MPRTNTQHPSADDTAQDRRERWKLRIEIAGFFLLLAGGVVGYMNLVALGEQNKILSEQVHNGQRAYVTITNVRLSEAGGLRTGAPAMLHWDSKNIGATPAINLVTRYAIWIGPRESEPPSMLGYSERHTLATNESEPSPDVHGVWLGGRGGYTLTDSDMGRLMNGEVLNVRICVTYSTIFAAIQGSTLLTGFYEGSRFSTFTTELK